MWPLADDYYCDNFSHHQHEEGKKVAHSRHREHRWTDSTRDASKISISDRKTTAPTPKCFTRSLPNYADVWNPAGVPCASKSCLSALQYKTSLGQALSWMAQQATVYITKTAWRSSVTFFLEHSGLKTTLADDHPSKAHLAEQNTIITFIEGMCKAEATITQYSIPLRVTNVSDIRERFPPHSNINFKWWMISFSLQIRKTNGILGLRDKQTHRQSYRETEWP